MERGAGGESDHVIDTMPRRRWETRGTENGGVYDYEEPG